MRYTLFAFLFNLNGLVFGQNSTVPISKPVIDSAAINHWPVMSPFSAISPDGHFMMYSIENEPIGSRTMIVQAVDGGWRKEFAGLSGGFFSADSRQFIYKDADTLVFLSLGSSDVSYLIGVGSVQQTPAGGWLIYYLVAPAQEMVLRDMRNGRERRFEGVSEYIFNEKEDRLLLKSEYKEQVGNKNDSQVGVSLQWISLPDGKCSIVWSGLKQSNIMLKSYGMDRAGKQVAFMTGETQGERTLNTLWYFAAGMTKPAYRISDTSSSAGLDGNLSLDGNGIQFSGDGRYIYLGLVNHEVLPRPSPDAISVDVWSYKDSLLQSAQLYRLKNGSPVVYTAVVAAGGGAVIRLEHDLEAIQARQPAGDYVVVGRNNNGGDRFWLRRPDSNWLVSLRDGSRTPLRTEGYSEFAFSPDGYYLIYYDADQDGNYFSYDLLTGRIRKISSGIPARSLAWSDEFTYRPGKGFAPGNSIAVGLVGWMPEDTAVLVGDNYDIWKLSLKGRGPINITGGYGRLHHTRLRVVDDYYMFFNDNITCYNRKDTLLLVAFDKKTKYNGFYKLLISGDHSPILLSMGPWTLWHKSWTMNINSNEFAPNLKPLKAAQANSWLLLRCTATEAPNYFLTHDFIHYQPLTDLQPQRRYNWLTTELVSWKQPDGINAQGVLYKPEDFDPRKKYPVLINYYQQLSHRVYEYPQPEYTGSAHINIPWFVSRGYLVLTPDFYYKDGEMGPSVCTTILSAVRMLSTQSYVNIHKMAISGHSLGGTETNYLVTHTHQFAAVLSGAAGHNGVDLISNSLALDGFGDNWLETSERGDMQSTLWQHPERWIQNSPIFQADKITSPLLIYYCKADNDWERAIEFFIALRRLGKKVWLLQYDHGGHAVFGKEAEDFTIRVTQFFDHYLKDAPAPTWMTRGIPARLKGIDMGYGSNMVNEP